jgi:hypothetical protein
LDTYVGELVDGTLRGRIEHPAAAQDKIPCIHRGGSYHGGL